MGLFKWISLALLAFIGYVAYEVLFKVPPLPHIPDTYWGKGRPRPDDVAIYPFTINVTDSVSKNGCCCFSGSALAFAE
ncbi:juvenile hormone epoxide hydrolase 1-like [Diaphorina citri]|jgi:hypothetical protein|uniref:Juvenile hormone epoxide hydrolase 1-like n=1 Tax=Diaphorina citri TaxID=121845 RepID=A0A3Q0J4M9_DIACI|nr:juvenile hormone epoxide hydrolase 1-like [Diaphorina citri]